MHLLVKQCATTKDSLTNESAAERRAGYTLVPLVRFANGAELREVRQCVQSNREQERLTFALTALLPAQCYALVGGALWHFRYLKWSVLDCRKEHKTAHEKLEKFSHFSLLRTSGFYDGPNRQ